jgi:hypothetical protein
MHGDFSRRTFDGGNGYRAVLMQQGRVLLDADWNEQADITGYQDEVRTAAVVGRSGGPAPEPGATGVEARGPFAIVTPAGPAPDGSPWEDLLVTPGRYYVDGILCESAPPPGGADGSPPLGWPLSDQPHLPAVTVDGASRPGLEEPRAEGRYAVYLDVWHRQVTFDEDPALLEPALGGPDTTTRSQTVWQVRLAPLADGELCDDLHADGWLQRRPRRMAAELEPPDSSADPCQITSTGGYQRLENQLYRVQVHAGSGTESGGTFLWSRQNGCVVAGLDSIEVTDEATKTAVLTIDRLGRDEELSFGEHQIVEVTSTDRELRGLAGFLARTGAPTGLQLPVTWLDDVPGSLGELGAAPIVRRWEGGPLAMTPAVTGLEAGIGVRFPDGGQARTGDYWLIPARTVRLAYGLDQVSGTIGWPPGGHGPAEQPPAGSLHHLAPLGILVRDDEETWSLESDCRRLFPPLTGLVTIDMAGGDGQEAMPGEVLPEPVRVMVRNGGLPFFGAWVRATASDGGHVAVTHVATTDDPDVVPGRTGPSGLVGVWWLLNPSGPTTQTLTIQRLDDHDQLVDVAVTATARLSVASQVRWTPVCERFEDTRTVQDALERLARTREIRLLSGDGQVVAAPGELAQRPVRVVVDGACGPLAGVKVVATAKNDITGPGLVAEVKESDIFAPETLPGAESTAVVPTGPDGVAAFWWQPSFGNMRWSTLDVEIEGSAAAPIRVIANLDVAGGADRPPGIHITGLSFANGKLFENDQAVLPADLASGIRVDLDARVLAASVQNKPVVRVLLDLPWPLGDDGDLWSGFPIGFRTVELDGIGTASGTLIRWLVADHIRAWVQGQLGQALSDEGWRLPIVGRFVVDGWAVMAENNPQLHLNCHASTVLENGRTRLVLPTDDEVTGGQFVQWFTLVHDTEELAPAVEVPDVTGMTQARAVRELEAAGLVTEVTNEPSSERRKGLVLRTEPAAGARVDGGSGVTVVVSAGRQP